MIMDTDLIYKTQARDLRLALACEDSPVFPFPKASHLAFSGLAIILLAGGATLQPATGSSVIVPDDHVTVQLGIDSGADTVMIREGTYSERPVVDHAVVLQGIGTGRRPRLAGLQIFNSYFFAVPPLLSVSRIDFSGRVEHTTLYYRPRELDLRFSQCALDSGFYQLRYLDSEDVDSLSIRDCRLGGTSSARVYQVIMEADTVAGNVSWSNDGASIQRCWFRGGSGTALELLINPRGGATNNLIENYDIGVYVQEPNGFSIDRNRIGGCGSGLVLQSSLDAEASGNAINDCGIGIDVRGGDDIQIGNNTILRAGEYGIWAREASDLVAERNVVGRCGSRGILLQWYDWAYRSTLRGNTVFGSGGSGVEVRRPPGFGAVPVENNIGFGNGEWGVEVSAGELVQLGCNDWFGNGLGAISGSVADSTDLSVDPMFCNVDSADVRLNWASPLLADSATCGQIGALGVGCGVTPTLVQRFTAGRVSAGIQVVWEVADGASATAVWVERSEGGSEGPWVRPVTERSIDNGAVVDFDRSAIPDRK